MFSIFKIYFGLHKQDLQGSEHFCSLCKGQLTLTAWVILLLLLKRCPADNCFKNSILYYYYKQDDDDLQPYKGLSSAWFLESWEREESLGNTKEDWIWA